MIRILFIDDEESSIRDARECCQDGMENSNIETCGFEDAEAKIQAFRPDIVILDLLRGSLAEQDMEGDRAYQFIWKDQFCPIVIYSAAPTMMECPDHPFLKKVTKGSDSEERVLEAVQDFWPHIQALQSTEVQIRQCLSKALQAVAPHVFRLCDDENKQAEIIMRSGRRRVAAMMDEPPSGEPLASWECYLHPPMYPDAVQLGDILKMKDGDNCEPGSFRVVLTPSCDMVQSASQASKVQNVLVAKCCSMEEALSAIGMAGNRNSRRLKERLLNSGHAQSVIPFPALEDQIPTMAADLHNLELIPIQNIGNKADFLTVASLDSPFRELIAWAYLQNAGRPGLPGRNLESWAKEIIDTVSPK